MKKNIKILSGVLLIIMFFTSNCLAGSVNLTIVHEKPDVKVVKYIIKYGKSEKINPEEYPNIKEVVPYGNGFTQSVTVINLGDGISGECFFSVKDVYVDGTESEFSESSFPIMIPIKPMNLKIN